MPKPLPPRVQLDNRTSKKEQSVRLRPVERKDLDLLAKWINDPEVVAHTGPYEPISMLRQHQWFEAVSEDPNIRLFGIEQVQDSRLIGSCGLYDIHWRIRMAELRMRIGDKASWGQGLGTEATHRLVDFGFHDLGSQEVKNIAEPVHAFEIRATTADGGVSDATEPALALPDKPSIAVLPFDNIGNDEEQEYFADGITEDLITALSRIHSFFVTARNSSFSYKGQSPDIRQVADDLGVRYVLEGSVRKAGRRVRITSQLIDGTTGNHLWAERYDREIGDVFDLQDEMTEKIVGAIEPAISKSEIQRSRLKRPDNLDAWDLCQHGWWHRYRNRREDYVSARSFFERAIEKDPEFVSALAGLADTLAYEVVFSFAEEPAAQVERAIDLGRRAVEFDDEDPVAHLSLGRAYLAGRQFENGIRALREALRLNPYFAAAQYSLGGLYIVTGRFLEGIDAIRKMIALSPQDLFMGPSYARLAQAFLALKDYEKAVENAEEAFRCPVQPHWPGKSYLVSALGHLGRQGEAMQAIEELQGLVPGITISWVRSRDLPISMGQDFTEDYLDGLRKAGLPE